MKPVDVLGLNIELAHGSPLVLLRERDEPHRVLPIFVGEPEAIAIGFALSGDTPPRPLTHDLVAALLESLDVQVERVEVTELRDGTFHAAVALRGPTGERRLDSRPSDGIAVALRVDAPVFVNDSVLDEAGAILAVPDEEEMPGEADAELIEDEVARFRSFLEELEPTAFAAGEQATGTAPAEEADEADEDVTDVSDIAEATDTAEDADEADEDGGDTPGPDSPPEPGDR